VVQHVRRSLPRADNAIYELADALKKVA